MYHCYSDFFVLNSSNNLDEYMNYDYHQFQSLFKMFVKSFQCVHKIVESTFSGVKCGWSTLAILHAMHGYINILKVNISKIETHIRQKKKLKYVNTVYYLMYGKHQCKSQNIYFAYLFTAGFDVILMMASLCCHLVEVWLFLLIACGGGSLTQRKY